MIGCIIYYCRLNLWRMKLRMYWTNVLYLWKLYYISQKTCSHPKFVKPLNWYQLNIEYSNVYLSSKSVNLIRNYYYTLVLGFYIVQNFILQLPTKFRNITLAPLSSIIFTNKWWLMSSSSASQEIQGTLASTSFIYGRRRNS